jgi:hypothetical protein
VIRSPSLGELAALLLNTIKVPSLEQLGEVASDRNRKVDERFDSARIAEIAKRLRSRLRG